MKTNRRMTAIFLMLIMTLGSFGTYFQPQVAKATEYLPVDSKVFQLDTVVSGCHGDNECIYKKTGQAGWGGTDDQKILYSFITSNERMYYTFSYKSNLSKGRARNWYICSESQLELPDWSDCTCTNGDSLFSDPSGTYNVGCLPANKRYYIGIPYSENNEETFNFRINAYKDDVVDDANESITIEPDQSYSFSLETELDLDCFNFDAGAHDYSLTISSDSSIAFAIYGDDLLTEEVTSNDGTGTFDLKDYLKHNKRYWITFKLGSNPSDPSYSVETLKYTFSLKTQGQESDSQVTVPNVGPVNISPANKKVTLKWKKVKGASGYQIYRSLKKKKGYTLLKTIKKGKTVLYVDKKVKSGKTYYYKIRAFKKVGGSTKYGGWSSVKKVKVK